MLKEKKIHFDNNEKHCFNFLPKHHIFKDGLLSGSDQFQELKKLIE